MGTVRCPLLVGRASEFRELTDLVAGAATGEGGSAFVLGEAGIGKSRMLAAVADVARSREMTVLRGRAAASSAPAPYRPLAEAFLSALRGHELAGDATLARYRSALGVLVPGSSEVTGADDPSVVLLGEATLALVERCASRAGVVMVLEDLQWADAETCELIDYLVDKLEGRSIALLASVQTGGPSEAARLAHSVAARRHGLLVPLGRLDAKQVDAMIGAALGAGATPAGLGELVTAASGGVPFLVEELLASLIQGGAVWRDGAVWRARPSLPTLVPRSFETIVADRLGGLTATARTVLDAAAVLGERFDWRLLPAVAGLAEDEVVAALAEAVQAQLIDEVPGPPRSGFRFHHGLSRAAVLEAVGQPQRERLARRALAVLDIDADASDGAGLEILADLALAAGDASRAARALIGAAVAAARLGAYGSARRSAELAVTLATCHAEAVDANEVLLDACAASGDAARAAEVGEVLLADLGRLGAAADRVANVHLRLAAAAVEATDWPRAEAHVNEVTALLPSPPAALRARTDLVRTSIALGRHQPLAAAEHAESARRAATETGEPLLLAEASALLGRAHRVTDLEAARRDFANALAAAERTGSPLAVARAMHELATLDVLVAGPTAAMEAARGLADAAGGLALAATADLHLGILHWLHFDLEAARVAAGRALDAAVRYDLGLLEPASAVMLASADAVSGRRQAALARFEQYRTRMDDEIEATARGHVVAMAALVCEDRTAALAELNLARQLAPPYSDVARAPQCGMRALLLAVESDPSASDVAEGLRADLAVVGVARALTELALAVLAGRSGEFGRAATQAEAALDALRVTPWLRAMAQRLVAEAALADGWRSPARWLADAHDFFETAGIPEPVVACRRLLRQAGAPTPRRPADGQHPDLARLGVTSREAEVLELVALGLSNREVAERLYLSVRTVEKHVERLMTKTSTGSRVQLAAFAHQLAQRTAGPT